MNFVFIVVTPWASIPTFLLFTWIISRTYKWKIKAALKEKDLNFVQQAMPDCLIPIFVCLQFIIPIAVCVILLPPDLSGLPVWLVVIFLTVSPLIAAGFWVYDSELATKKINRLKKLSTKDKLKLLDDRELANNFC